MGWPVKGTTPVSPIYKLPEAATCLIPPLPHTHTCPPPSRLLPPTHSASLPPTHRQPAYLKMGATTSKAASCRPCRECDSAGPAAGGRRGRSPLRDLDGGGGGGHALTKGLSRGACVNKGAWQGRGRGAWCGQGTREGRVCGRVHRRFWALTMPSLDPELDLNPNTHSPTYMAGSDSLNHIVTTTIIIIITHQFIIITIITTTTTTIIIIIHPGSGTGSTSPHGSGSGTPTPPWTRRPGLPPSSPPPTHTHLCTSCSWLHRAMFRACDVLMAPAPPVQPPDSTRHRRTVAHSHKYNHLAPVCLPPPPHTHNPHTHQCTPASALTRRQPCTPPHPPTSVHQLQLWPAVLPHTSPHPPTHPPVYTSLSSGPLAAMYSAFSDSSARALPTEEAIMDASCGLLPPALSSSCIVLQGGGGGSRRGGWRWGHGVRGGYCRRP